MEVGMPDLIDTRLLRRSDDDEVIVLVTSRVNLVWRSQQFDKHEKSPTHVAAGRVSKIGVRFEKRARDRRVIAGNFRLVRGLELLPEFMEACFAVKADQQFTKAFDQDQIGRLFETGKARLKVRWITRSQRQRY